jgi:hypothetical protein
MFDLLSAYWPGDTIIELDPTRGVERGADGTLSAWANQGGIEFFQEGLGWRTYARSRGRFLPSGGAPVPGTSAGVSALAFTGKEALRWDQATWDALDGNRAWSVELWVQRAPAAGGGTLLDWGGDGKAARLAWGADDEAWRFGQQAGRWNAKPQPGGWHHLFYVYSGGGLQNGPGTLTVHVDGKVDHRATVALDLPTAAQLTVGRGFSGALGWLRIYNYELHPLQIAAISAQDAWFARDQGAVAGSLLVDLAADALAPYQQEDVWPTYPEALRKPWLRSWANRGLLGGRIRNEGGATRNAGPRAALRSGAPAVCFGGDARMASELLPALPAALSIELWAEVAARQDPAAVLVQLGDALVPAALVPAGGWHHVVVSFGAGRDEAWVDGRSVALPSAQRAASVDGKRLCLGARWDGRTWSGHLDGAIAALRVHAGILGREQIAANLRAGAPNHAAAPNPPDRGEVVDPAPALSWGLGLRPGAADVYFGSDAEAVAHAGRDTPGIYQGRHVPGAFRPRLKPGQDYAWRVDALDEEGRPLGRGSCWTFRAVHGLVVDLDAAELGTGAFSAWRNRGAAGGAFTPGTMAETWMPMAEPKDGRKAVSFDGGTYLVSSFRPPASLAKAFTVAAWVYADELPGSAKERSNTFLALGVRDAGGSEFLWNWQPQCGLFAHGTRKERVDFGLRSGIDDPKAAREALPGYMALRWHHVAYAYDGATLRIHVDGRLNREEKAAIALAGDSAFCLGAARGERRMESWFNGWVAELALCDRALPEATIAALARGGAAKPADWLVSLSALDLSPGRVATWPNHGTLGGAFALDQEPMRAPVVEEVAGKRALTFDGKSSFLRSDFTTPPVLAGGHAFTVEALVFDPKVDQVETIVALAPTIAMQGSAHLPVNRQANCNLGTATAMDAASKSNDIPGAFAGGKPTLGWNEPPPGGRWCQVTWVYSGGGDGEVTCYVDGLLRARRGAVALDTVTGHPLHLGAAWHTAQGPLTMFSGSLASLRIYDHARPPVRSGDTGGR